jgi:hypothetical protein
MNDIDGVCNGSRGCYPYGRLKYIFKFMEEREYWQRCHISEVFKLNRVYQK